MCAVLALPVRPHWQHSVTREENEAILGGTYPAGVLCKLARKLLAKDCVIRVENDPLLMHRII